MSCGLFKNNVTYKLFPSNWNLSYWMTLKANNSEFDKKIEKNMSQWLNKYLEFEHAGHINENRMQTKANEHTAEWGAKSNQAALFQFSNKLVVKHNFGTNYVQQLRL